jgi:hypothetical protein
MTTKNEATGESKASRVYQDCGDGTYKLFSLSGETFTHFTTWLAMLEFCNRHSILPIKQQQQSRTETIDQLISAMLNALRLVQSLDQAEKSTAPNAHIVDLDPQARQQVCAAITAGQRLQLEFHAIDARECAARITELNQRESRIRKSLDALGQNATAGLLRELSEVVDEKAAITKALDIRKV